MTLNVYNKEFELIGIIDEYNEIVWPNSYNSLGNVVLDCIGSKNNLELLKMGNILSKPKTSEAMIITSYENNYSNDTGLNLKIEGNSLSNILSYRINTQILNYNNRDLKYIVFDIISKNAIETINKRKISKLNLLDDSNIYLILDTYQNSYDSLLDVVTSLCSAYEIGFKIDLNYKDKRFDFNLYKGLDLTGSDGLVLFGDEYDNIKNTEYFEIDIQYKNTALVGGQGDGVDRRLVMIDVELFDLDRREVFIDARDITNVKDSENDMVMSDEEYIESLNQRGKQRLEEFKIVQTFNSDIDQNSKNFLYGKDYNLGDIVLIKNNRELMKKRICSITEVYNNQTQINISFGNDFNYNL